MNKLSKELRTRDYSVVTFDIFLIVTKNTVNFHVLCVDSQTRRFKGLKTSAEDSMTSLFIMMNVTDFKLILHTPSHNHK